jgi:hypothetical protein
MVEGLPLPVVLPSEAQLARNLLGRYDLDLLSRAVFDLHDPSLSRRLHHLEESLATHPENFEGEEEVEVDLKPEEERHETPGAKGGEGTPSVLPSGTVAAVASLFEHLSSPPTT